MKTIYQFTLILMALGLTQNNILTAQVASEIIIRNGSFEAVPHKGGANKSISGWFDCGWVEYNKRETPPDIHDGKKYLDLDDFTSKTFWDNKLKASDGNTFLGMVVRDNDSHEFLSQRLSENLTKDKCYNLSMELAQSPDYNSHTHSSRIKKVNFNRPIVLRVWGGSNHCEQKQLLSESPPVDHAAWKTYDFSFKAKYPHRYVTIEAFYVTPVLEPYNGHILVDNLSNFVLIPCPDEQIVAVAKSKPFVPPHKKKRKKPVEVDAPTKADELVYVPAPAPVKKRKSVKARILKELNKNTIKKGQRINIESLFFKADTSKINESSYLVLDEVYEFLDDNPTIVVEIGGHTNNVPSHNYCDKLSTDRAREVAWYLIKKGIDEDRVEFKGYGKRKPIASNKSKLGRTKNQRVEIKILSV